MATEVTLPALGESVTEGTVSRWLKAVGDRVEVDEALVEVSTDKVDTEIPSPAAGVVLEIRVAEDDVAEVGAVLAVIGEESEAGAAAAPAAPAAPAPAEQVVDAQEQVNQTEAAPADPSAAEAPAGGVAAEAPADAQGTEVTLPALGESVTEGTVSRWLKSVGDTVEADEALVEVSTDKVDTEIPSPAAGTVLEIRVKEDEVAEVGAVLAIIGTPGAAPAAVPATPAPKAAPAPQADAPAAAPAPQAIPAPAAPTPQPTAANTNEGVQVPAAEAQAPAAPVTPPAPAASPAHAAAPAADGESVYVTPLVRKLASENGVALSEITGTGVGGRIRKQDVLAAAEAKKAPAPASVPASPAAPASPARAVKPGNDFSSLRGTTEKMSRMRTTIARRMVESLQVAAQLTATVEVDLTAISRLRSQHKDDFKQREGASLSYLPFITKAAIESLKAYPFVNATIDDAAGEVTYHDAEHIGIAVDTDKGLMVPVIKDAGDLNIAGLAKKIGDLAARTRASKVTPDELSGGTFTITNYGSAGTLFDTPIINQPQVAILGTGALVKRPVVVEDQFGGETIAVRDMMYLSLTYDHRLVDGAKAALFLSAVKARLEEGDFAG
ncbi:MAG TPA: 2-oxoglutarate dehydrogenase, E2 component, dihydrolipoamide succinyltransferase, partial [Candidatus Luteococcus avicola]|nr:2-oxoglutarate dehydrogenase, E2 component, dihydrolipoamide succinyltransferase [Candidatus Luteococcus avicola]